MLKVTIFYIFASIFAGSSLQNERKGTDVKPNEFPYVVSFRGYKTHECTATMLDPIHLLTSAHCVYRRTDNPTAFSVQHSLVKTSVDDNSAITAFKIMANTQYSDSGNGKKYDIAIIRLETEIPNFENKTINYTRNYFEGEPRKDGQEEKEITEFIGWGLNKDGIVTNLQNFEFKLLTDDECKKVDKVRIDTEFHTCGQMDLGSGKPCDNYSGSPLIANKTIQVGIASWYTKNESICTVIFTKVAKFQEWIRKTLEGDKI